MSGPATSVIAVRSRGSRFEVIERLRAVLVPAAHECSVRELVTIR